MGVDPSRRQNGVGTQLLNEIKRNFSRVCLWADYNSVNFYVKNDFRISKMMYYDLQTKIGKFDESDFRQWGFSVEDKDTIKIWGKTANQKAKNDKKTCKKKLKDTLAYISILNNL